MLFILYNSLKKNSVTFTDSKGVRQSLDINDKYSEAFEAALKQGVINGKLEIIDQFKTLLDINKDIEDGITSHENRYHYEG